MTFPTLGGLVVVPITETEKLIIISYNTIKDTFTLTENMRFANFLETLNKTSLKIPKFFYQVKAFST